MNILILMLLISLPQTENSPTIDGNILENEWNGSYRELVFLNQFQPEYGPQMEDSTEIYISYDEENIYFLLKAYQDTLTLISKTSTRDGGFNQDWVGVIIDPLATKQEGYIFLFSLGGSVMDAHILKSSGGFEDYSWDGVVEYSPSKTGYGYFVEAKIPFSNFRRSGNKVQTWSFNFMRHIYKENRKGLYYLPESWQNDFLISGGISVELEGIKGKAPLYVTPYGIWGATVEDSIGNEKANAGFDLRLPVSTEGVANFAFNPDFSQLEGDPLQFDFNSRYALYQREYRPFFKEESGIFDVESEIFYSRNVQNPFLAGRYTYKGQSNSLGVLIAYDEKDDELYNNEAYTGLFRYIRNFNSNYMSLMYVGRKNFDDNTVNSVVMTDANVEFSNFTFYYSIAASQLNQADSSYMGYFHEIAPRWKKNDYSISLWYDGMSPEFVNETGYIGNNNYKNLGIGFRKLWRTNGSIVKNFQIRLNGGYSGEWDLFHDNLTNRRDSLEYFYSIGVNSSLFTSTNCGFWMNNDKYLFNNEFYYTTWMNFHFSTRLFSKISFWGGAGTGYSVDYNYERLGKSISSWSGFYYSILDNLSFSISGDIELFYADTSGFARKPSEIEETDRQWRTISNEFSLYYTVNSEMSISLSYQSINAVFADYYWSENNNIDDDKFFGVLTYKPSPGNVIYFGGRLPEKMIFFKFSHRFSF